jgi:hypothetical protein
VTDPSQAHLSGTPIMKLNDSTNEADGVRRQPQITHAEL